MRLERNASAHAVVLGAALSLPPMLMLSSTAEAVPSFTRQTGLTCGVCHSNPPELTAFGRKFKLEGYTLMDNKPDATIAQPDLQLNRWLPISAMVLLDETATAVRVPGAQTTNAGFPQALSLFLAGEIAPDLGGMLQLTYSHQSDRFTLDNTDLRYARHTTLGKHDLLYGFTLNNGPTVEDVWNGTPAWGFPWLSTDSAPEPTAGPIIAGALAQDVAGLGTYVLWSDHLYAGLSLYQSEHAGGPQPLDGVDFPLNISGVAPYARLAWQQAWGSNDLEFGAYGIDVLSTPGGTSGTSNRYTDVALDLQYERHVGIDLLSAHATWIHERSTLDGTLAAGGAAQSRHRLDTVRVDATWHVRSRYTATLAGLSTIGTPDSILFAPAPVTGSAKGTPDSSRIVGQIGVWPWQNVELSIAWTEYLLFNGARRNYDGAGRNASDNSSLYVATWLNF